MPWAYPPTTLSQGNPLVGRTDHGLPTVRLAERTAHLDDTWFDSPVLRAQYLE
jgi:hypothetical protein